MILNNHKINIKNMIINNLKYRKYKNNKILKNKMTQTSPQKEKYVDLHTIPETEYNRPIDLLSELNYII